MTQSTLTTATPIPGPAYDRERPETRQAWWDFRLGGLTATDMRDCRQGAARRRIITEKVTGDAGEEPFVKAWRHGTLREPQIAAWAQATYGITPTGGTFASGENSRHIASPDGVMIDPFTGRYEPGTEDSIIEEIKTGVDDLTPGEIDAAGVLIALDPRSTFNKRGYYRQVQWQMLVMNATRALFVWERHNGEVDPETSTYTPVGPPQAVWINRDEEAIAGLLAEADALLAEIDAARLQFALDGLPPVSENMPAEHAILVADLLRARDAEAVASAQKKKAWDALNALYMGEDKPDVQIDGGFAKITVSTSIGSKPQVDEEAMKRKAPTLVAKYEALRKRHTRQVPTAKQTLTVTRSKNV
ncbi:exonuclease [Microbacterium phage Cressida]|uniref:Exonuclease n=1 Tax=Microbacterium phage Cressida TaxID=2591216 RepID=A0A514DI47_9CAUD|nr:exonuclease [Microbacterium phage Cressida]QDH93289.1 exonuclease [Microbacterium phage Cressida]